MEQSHKITLFLPSLNDGGAERVFLNLAADFLRRGHAVDLLIYKAIGPYFDQLPEGVNLISLHCNTQWGSLWQLLKYIWREKPAHILSALPEANLLNIAARLVGGVRYRCIITEHTILSENLRIKKSSFWHNVKHAMIRFFYKFAGRVIVVSKAAAKDMESYCGVKPGRISVIYNPVYYPGIADKAAEDPLHEWLGADKTARPYKVLLSVGRFIPEKDHETLLKAFAKLRESMDARLILLGGGPREHMIREQIAALKLQDVVSLPGFVQNPYAFMARADVLVLHSTHEGFGNVLIESMAVGTPVVSTNCHGGPAEILENGTWGALVPPRDDSALAGAIAETLKNPPHTLGSYQARASEFSVEAASLQYLSLLFPDAVS
ncbi:MAG: glycosyltransferase [Alphaproteobacteria bacterium]|nr:glycosyltransferase [Alphaproteobacteria bacterium]MCD8570400.1 glycosyltransferase [Alphaproteobacteria bacterium]